MRRLAAIPAVIAVILLVGCGHDHKTVTPPTITICSGLTDTCHTVLRSRLPKASLAPAGCKIPDVSSFQGHPNWAAVKQWQLAQHCPGAGIFKLGEFITDPDAAFNATSLHQQGMIAIGYWFVRPTGCVHEADQIIAEARALGIRVVVEDDEVHGVVGYATCLAAPLRAAGFVVVLYTSPGSWGGGDAGGLPAWEATFGPSLGCLPWTCHPIAWQYTDGVFGAATFVPGIGLGDVSVDRGLLALAAPPKPKPPKPSRAQVTHWRNARASSQRAYVKRGCTVLSQRISWFGRRLHGPKAGYRRRALNASRRAYRREDCRLFKSRVTYFAHKLAT